MSQVATLNNVAFTIPDVGDEDWGQNVTDYLLAIPTSVLQLSANQTLTGNITFANAKGVRFSELTANGTNYIALVAPDSVTANITLKLPDSVGSAGQVLSSDGTGIMSWINAAGGGTINTGVQGRLAIYVSAGTTLDDVVTMTNTISVAIAAHGQGSVYTIPDSGAATADFVLTAGTQTIAGAKTLSGVVVVSNNSTAAFSISQASTLKVDSTNALVSIGTTTMTYPLYVSKSTAGANVTITVENTESANGASNARLYVVTGGASGGDPLLTLYNGVQNYSIGLDNSDSDAFVITGAATLNGTNLVKMTTAGVTTFVDNMTLLKSFIGDIRLAVTNSLVNTSAGAQVQVGCEAGAYDPRISFVLGGGGDDWTVGVDNSDSDKFKISNDVTELGTNTWLTIAVGGATLLGGAVTFAANVAMAGFKHTGLGAGSAAGESVRFEQLKIIQVVSAITSTETSSTSGTYADTTLTAAITPTSASNKILVVVSQACRGTIGVAKSAAIMGIKLLRGASNIYENDRAFGVSYGSTNFGSIFGYATFSYMDSPATTSSTTYKTQFCISASGDGSVTVQPGGSVNNPSTIMLIEVAP